MATQKSTQAAPAASVTVCAPRAAFKLIEPTATAITEMQNALNEADYLTQGAEEKIQAAAHAIRLMLREPDSGHMRLRIKTLSEMIEYHSFDVMNTVNCLAERHGAHYVDEVSRVEESRIHAAVRGEVQS